MKVMCAHCGSPNLDTDAACYDCGKPPVASDEAGGILVPEEYSPEAIREGLDRLYGTGLKGKLPNSFPGHAALEAAGIVTYEQLQAIPDLTAIVGIGEATAKKIAEALESGE